MVTAKKSGREIIFHRSEAQVLRDVCEYLTLRRHFFWRQNNGGVFDAARGAYRTNRFTIKGVPDIFVLDGNRLIALEAKSDTGRQSPEQKAFEGAFTSPPFRTYYVIRGVRDVEKLGL